MGDAERPNPWRRLARRTVYENPWIRVHHDDVVRPDGLPGIYGVVEFRSVAVGIVALDERDRVLLVGQYRYTLDAYSWEIPEGGVPFDEPPLEGARRELAEETGYRAAEWRELLRLATSNSVTTEVGVLFVARGLTPGAAEPDGTEQLELRWVTLDEAVAMIDRGEITDALSQAALLRYALERRR
ncbi:MAG TPA: NUDIX hydrolase [Candidatus Limnocylindrales bacterium]|nr:NUDIX hydrolase [Candidatus Limnocylindrales bacterium]